MATNFNAGAQMFYTRPSDGATYCFSPVPFLAESKEFATTADGNQRLGTIHQVTFNGWLIAALPALTGVAPNSSCLQILDRKSDQLCDALSEDFGNLLIIDASGYPVISERPRIISLDFEESQMVSTRQYSLVVQYNKDFDDDTKVSEFNETWNFGQQEDDTLNVSHNVSAVGVADPIAGTTPFENARDFVISKINASGLPDKTNSTIMRIPYVDSLLDIDVLQPFNHVLTESVDLTGGSYEIDETWLLASGAFQDDRTIEKSFSLNETNVLVQTININGTVQGYGETTFDKFTSALDGFNNFVIPQIGFNSASGITSKVVTENRIAGTVTYSIARIPQDPDEQLESRSIQRTVERQDDGSVVQSVVTSASIKQGSASGIQLAIDFCFANNFPIDSAEPIFDASLSGNLITVSTSRDDIAKSFSLNRSFHDQSTSLYREEVQVDRAQGTDTSIVSITIQGTVFGLGVESSTKGNARFLSASGAFFGPGGVESQIAARVAALVPTGSCIGDTPSTSTLSTSEFAGTIAYNQTFESRFKTDNDDVLREEIEVTFQNPAEVIAVIPIPAKVDGPVLQDQQTKTGRTKGLSITYTMRRTPNDCKNSVAPNNFLLSEAFNESDILVVNTPTANPRGEKPESSKVFKTADQHTWNRQTLVFTRQVTWQYL